MKISKRKCIAFKLVFTNIKTLFAMAKYISYILHPHCLSCKVMFNIKVEIQCVGQAVTRINNGSSKWI